MTSVAIDTMQQLQTANNFKFSAVPLDQLGATEYTLATVVVDVSGSVASYKKQLEDCLKTIAKSCQKSPRSANLMLRVVAFNENLQEIHGFKLLSDIKANTDYNGALNPNGSTALFDAAQSSVEAAGDYGKLLADQDFYANAVVYVITDGEDNASKFTPKTIKKIIDKIGKEEKLASIAVVLIGVGYSDAGTSSYLDSFKNDAGITQFVDLTELFQKTSPEATLAKLAGYISKSISSTSKSLASGSSSAVSSKLTI
jgi:uncharacterized protein YegL